MTPSVHSRDRNAVSFHSLRHTATSLLKAAGVSESFARDIIGHESAQISRLYTHVEDDAKRAAARQIARCYCGACRQKTE